jgi:hypothetical protein
MNVVNFDFRHCERIRGQLDAYVSDELLVETTSEVITHLETCESCSRELDSQVRVREALRRAVRNQLTPAALSVVVHQRLRQAPPSHLAGFRAMGWVLALAASAVVILAGSVAQRWVRMRHGRQLVSSVLQLGVSDHVQCAIKGHNYPEVANPPDQLRSKLGPEYAGLLHVVEARLPGFQVLEAHLCSVPGSPRKYVHFITRGHETILSVIITKREREGLPVGRVLVAEASDGVNLYRAHIDEMDVVGFESKDYFGFVVSDLGQSKTVRLAAALAPGLRKALDGGAATGNSPAPAVLIRLSPSGLAWKTSLDGIRILETTTNY